VQGDLLAHGGKLYLAAGNWVPLAAYDLDDGSFQPAPPATLAWGVAVDRQGRVLVALRDGRILCFGT
jgi:hypothetical protein